jgi:bla regulator protein BlaR1
MMGTWLADWTARLLGVSIEAALLIGAILAVRVVVGRRISAQWRHALWLVLLLRLLLPWTPQTRYSVYSLVPQTLSSPLSRALAPAPQEAITPATRGSVGARDALGVVWLIGAAGFACWLLLQAARTTFALRGRRPVTEEAVLLLLEDCKEQLEIQTYLAVVETPRVPAPALFGWIRPRLLFPASLLDTLSRESLRHIFLHELSHLKRHDIAFNWLAAAAQALHWFNPLVWLAFREARSDMELACDEVALGRLEVHESSGYGHTILDLVTVKARPKRVPALAAIGEDADGIKRRIQMIAAFKKGQHTSPVLPVAILLLLGAVFLIDARQGATPAGSLGIPLATDTQERSTQPKAPPVDAAIKSASAWMALFDSADWAQTWDESHTVVRSLVSRQTWSGMCSELRRLEAAERGAPISRQPVGAEYISNLPMGLGDGISVVFRSKYGKGEYAGPRLLLAKDKDHSWRIVRSDKQ